MATQVNLQSTNKQSCNVINNCISVICKIFKAVFDVILWLPRQIIKSIKCLTNSALPPFDAKLQSFTGLYGSEQTIDHSQALTDLKKCLSDKKLNADKYALMKREDVKKAYDVNFNILDAMPDIAGSGYVNNPNTRVRYTGDQDIYIDANYIESVYEKRPTTDLACRCPRIDKSKAHASLDVFMRMIWDNKVDAIVNLVHPHPIIAFNDYIPALIEGKGLELFDNGSIKLLSKTELEAGEMFMEYRFQLTVGTTHRTLTFLHFKGMLDGDKEDLPLSRMKALITTIRSLNSKRKLIHCHAGVSRTGLVYTLLNVVAYLDDLKLPLEKLNVPDVILRLNISRYAMVNMKNTQRLEYIHTFIQDWIQGKDQKG